VRPLGVGVVKLGCRDNSGGCGINKKILENFPSRKTSFKPVVLVIREIGSLALRTTRLGWTPQTIGK